MKSKKNYAIIPEDRKEEFMRLVPMARLHAWPNTWSFGVNFKATVDAFLGAQAIVDAGAEVGASEVPDAAVVRLPTSLDRVITLSLSLSRLHALEPLLRGVSHGTVTAVARNENEQAAMQSALNALKAVLRAELKSAG